MAVIFIVLGVSLEQVGVKTDYKLFRVHEYED